MKRYWLTDKALEALDVAADPVTYAPSPLGAFPGPVVRPRCARCRLELGECEGHRGEAS